MFTGSGVTRVTSVAQSQSAKYIILMLRKKLVLREAHIFTILLLLLHHLSSSFHHVQAELGMLILLIFIKTKLFQIICLVSVTVDQVSSTLSHISASKATGLDELPARFIKDGSSVIAKPLTHIVNISITTGIIPDYLKAAMVVPLYNKKGRTNVDNYRPISVLSIISKVLEKVVFNQLNNFLTEHRIFIYFSLVFGRRTPLIHV